MFACFSVQKVQRLRAERCDGAKFQGQEHVHTWTQQADLLLIHKLDSGVNHVHRSPGSTHEKQTGRLACSIF